MVSEALSCLSGARFVMRAQLVDFSGTSFGFDGAQSVVQCSASLGYRGRRSVCSASFGPTPMLGTRSGSKGGGECKEMSASATAPVTTLSESAMASVSTKDFLVIGPGLLGSLVAQLWLKENEGCRVVGQTNTANHHENLRAIGVEPFVKGNSVQDKFPYVIFCAPPSGSADYAAEVSAAASRWNGKGSLLFTSTSGVFDVHDNCVCNESAPIVPKGNSPRTDAILNAEREVLKVGGNVVRLAGLYTLQRGAHISYLRRGTVDVRPDSLLNLIHYEDAASLSLTILKQHTRGRTFVGCDNHPISRDEMMDIVTKSGKFDISFEGFTGTGGPLGKKMNNNETRMELDWEPLYRSFTDFMAVQ